MTFVCQTPLLEVSEEYRLYALTYQLQARLAHPSRLSSTLPSHLALRLLSGFEPLASHLLDQAGGLH